VTSAYASWLREEAALIHADGCTGVTNLYADCCLQHDLEFYYAKSAADAYRQQRAGHPAPWRDAVPVTFDEANAHFRACHFRSSRFGYLNLVGWYRYAAMRLRKTRAAWDAHRAREAQPA